MIQDFVILCAAGMLVSVYLMVGQKALVVAIRLYGVQSLLLGAVGVAMGLAGPPAPPLRHRGPDHRAEGRR